MAAITSLIGTANGFLWGLPMLFVIGLGGIFLTIYLGGFQFIHQKDMWSRIFDKGDSAAGISTWQSFCTTMAMRVGTGNVAGVAVALFMGGPGAIFWMIVIGITNSAVCFTECTLGVLYKTRIDGQYRGGGGYFAERGLGWGAYGAVYSLIFAIGAACFMPAAATNTICDGFRNALGIPMWVSALVIAGIMAVVVIGGVKRIGTVASYVVPPMVIVYLIATVIIIVANITRLPSVVVLIVKNAFAPEPVMAGAFGVVLRQGVKRGTFSSASGMGESSPTAAAAETSHPVKQGMANAAGVWLDTVIVCTASALMMLFTDCYNTDAGYIGQAFGRTEQAAQMAAYAAEGYSGVNFVQTACSTVMGGIAPLFIAIMLALFSFTCLISYYYEAESSAMYLFERSSESTRKTVIWILRIGMPILIFIWGNVAAGLAWDLSDLALGSCTFINMIPVLLLSPKAVAMYKDYEEQMKAGKDPWFDPRKYDWSGVDKEMWLEINKDYIDGKK